MFDQQVTFLYTRDLDESAFFYGEKLGLPMVLDQGNCRIYRVGPDSFIGVCRCGESRTINPEGVIVTFVTDEVDDSYERLKAKNVAFESSPRANPEFNIYHCFLRDPDGYLLDIQRFDNPAWPRGASSHVSQTALV